MVVRRSLLGNIADRDLDYLLDTLEKLAKMWLLLALTAWITLSYFIDLRFEYIHSPAFSRVTR